MYVRLPTARLAVRLAVGGRCTWLWVVRPFADYGRGCVVAARRIADACRTAGARRIADVRAVVTVWLVALAAQRAEREGFAYESRKGARRCAEPPFFLDSRVLRTPYMEPCLGTMEFCLGTIEPWLGLALHMNSFGIAPG